MSYSQQLNRSTDRMILNKFGLKSRKGNKLLLKLVEHSVIRNSFAKLREAKP